MDDVDPTRLVIEPYTPADSDACLGIERRSPQGTSLQLGFRRPTFHRRGENFERYQLLVGRLEGRIVTVAGWAEKDVVLHGTPMRAAFYIDLRVDPDFRKQGLAARICAACLEGSRDRADMGYCYAMDDNRAMQALTVLFGCWDVAAYRYLVLPTYRDRAPSRPVDASSLSGVHESLLATAPPFELYTDPRVGGSTAGHVGSWSIDDATGRGGASAWDNGDILAEVVERVPWSLRAMRSALRLSPVPVPHVPAVGERLRSWYLFDVHGSRPEIVVDVVRAVTIEARSAGIDFLYIPWVPGDEGWVDALRAEVPKVFTLDIPYRLLVGPPLPERPTIRRHYVDPRDL